MSDTILLEMKVKPEIARTLFGILPKIRRRLDKSGVTATVLRHCFEWVLQTEGLYTESLFLKRTDDGDFVLWYMEADDINQFYDGFERAFESQHPLAIAAEKFIRTVFEEPEKALTGNEGNHELVIHGRNPERP